MTNNSSSVSPLSILINSIKNKSKKFESLVKSSKKNISEKKIHDLRVYSRRLISLNEFIIHLYGQKYLTKANNGLKRFLKSLNKLRDIHIILVYLSDIKPKSNELNDCISYFINRENQISKVSIKIIQSFTIKKLRNILKKLLDDLSEIEKVGIDQKKLQERVLLHTDLVYAKLLNRKKLLKKDDIKSIHRLRVSLKNFRYTLECVSLILPIEKNLLTKIQSFQTLLGKIQDAEIIKSALDKFKDSKQIQNGFIENLKVKINSEQKEYIDKLFKDINKINSFWSL